MQLVQLLLQSLSLELFQQLDLSEQPNLSAAQRLLLTTHTALQLGTHLMKERQAGERGERGETAISFLSGGRFL